MNSRKGSIILVDEEHLHFCDIKLDGFFLYEAPEELGSYFKIFELLKDEGKVYILSNLNDYATKLEYFEELLKISLK